ncbi:iron ABC transporter permease [Gottschalkiaceae bacterium SANA]|nr:iron ABC transporter permease [Gottschalkiaceae bacterium SANA]
MLAGLFQPVSENWEHIRTIVLERYVKNTLVLLGAVGLVTASVGTFLSWSLTQYDFKWNQVKMSLLLLPLAIPPYIGGYVYGGIFNYSGTLERIFRSLGWAPIHIDMLSMSGAIFVFSIFLMPYVILVTRGFFYRLPASYFESARLLGHSRFQTFFRVILPMSRGVIAGGTVLVLLEVLNDYGLVRYFGVPVFSTAIYSAWFGLGDVQSAIRLAMILMGIVFVVLFTEQKLTQSIPTVPAKADARIRRRNKPSKWLWWSFHSVYFLYLGAGVLIPVAQLLAWSKMASKQVIMRGLPSLIGNTLKLGLIVTVGVILCGLIIGNYQRLKNNFWGRFYSKLVVLGYSIPAPIIAVAVLLFFVQVDQSLQGTYQWLGLKNAFLTGSLFLLIFALTLRYMAIGYNSLSAGFNRIGRRYYDAARTLGASGWRSFWHVDFPMLKPAIFSAILLTFVDVLKELPLTLILRPFNFDTLATRVFTYAGDEMIHEASVYALLIIGVSGLALITMQAIQKRRKSYD